MGHLLRVSDRCMVSKMSVATAFWVYGDRLVIDRCRNMCTWLDLMLFLKDVSIHLWNGDEFWGSRRVSAEISMFVHRLSWTGIFNGFSSDESTKVSDSAEDDWVDSESLRLPNCTSSSSVISCSLTFVVLLLVYRWDDTSYSWSCKYGTQCSSPEYRTFATWISRAPQEPQNWSFRARRKIYNDKIIIGLKMTVRAMRKAGRNILANKILRGYTVCTSLLLQLLVLLWFLHGLYYSSWFY